MVNEQEIYDAIEAMPRNRRLEVVEALYKRYSRDSSYTHHNPQAIDVRGGLFKQPDEPLNASGAMLQKDKPMNIISRMDTGR